MVDYLVLRLLGTLRWIRKSEGRVECWGRVVCFRFWVDDIGICRFGDLSRW